jgi:hypothetical protein
MGRKLWSAVSYPVEMTAGVLDTLEVETDLLPRATIVMRGKYDDGADTGAGRQFLRACRYSHMFD